MAVDNGPPLQSMGLCGFVLAENQVNAEKVQEEPMEIKEPLSARSHLEEAVTTKVPENQNLPKFRVSEALPRREYLFFSKSGDLCYQCQCLAAIAAKLHQDLARIYSSTQPFGLIFTYCHKPILRVTLWL